MSKCICSFHSACSVFIWFQMLRSDLREKKKKKKTQEKKGEIKKERGNGVQDVKKGIKHSLKG